MVAGMETSFSSIQKVPLPVLTDLLLVRGFKIEHPVQLKTSQFKKVRLVAPNGESQEFTGVTHGAALRLAAAYVLRKWWPKEDLVNELLDKRT